MTTSIISRRIRSKSGQKVLFNRRLFAHGSPFSTNLPLVRDEIIQNWLCAEAKSSTPTKRHAQYCSFTYNDGVRSYQKSSAKWHWLDRELSSNVAGETGAVYVYKGALAAMSLVPGKKDALHFCQEHMRNEAAHLKLFETVVHDSKRTVLLPVWRMAGWVLGFLPTIVGSSKGLYVTVEAVETFVEEHYQKQIVHLKEEGMSTELVRLLEHCCEDEVHHKDDAAQKLLGPGQKEFYAWWAKPWAAVVRTGSTIAAEVARRI